MTPPPHRSPDDAPQGPALPPAPRWLKYAWAAGVTASVVGSVVVSTVAPDHPAGALLRALAQTLACPRMAEEGQQQQQQTPPTWTGPDLSSPATAADR